VQKGASKIRAVAATKEAGGENAIEGNREERICAFCEETATEGNGALSTL
jgi:hypothetical protein